MSSCEQKHSVGNDADLIESHCSKFSFSEKTQKQSPRDVLSKYLFKKISEYSQENACVVVTF